MIEPIFKTSDFFLDIVMKLCILFFLVNILSAFSVKNELALIGDEIIGEVIKSPIPRNDRDELPQTLDYRQQGLLTATLNQHIPVYCGR
jgi:hypothetical protein